MRKWMRWQDWVALAAGLYAAAAPVWMMTELAATRTMVVLGLLSALAAGWSLAMPADRISEYIHAFLGVLFFIAPWVMGFTDLAAMAYTAWVVGLVTIVMGMWATPMVQHRLHHAPSH